MLPILVILAVAILGLVFLRDHLSFEALAANREVLESYRDNNYLITAVGFIAAYVVIVAFSLPGATIATLTGGFLFGLYPGVFFNIIGATIGATGIFLAAKAGLGDRMAARMDASTGRLNKLKQELDGAQWSILFVMRLVPAVPFFVANLLPALVGVPLYRFVVSTFFGIIPGAIVLTSVGAGLGSVFASGETPDLGIIFEPRILFPILGLAALSLLPIVIRRFRKDR
ncbi:MAG: VTT domain-containing protein [Paracoccaceae bacterium]|nr:VTT domain-containing protein [Paracoccaceae bacterium]MDG2258633.1 VTT domain-containing protein [Paracoccaceae bacterium]